MKTKTRTRKLALSVETIKTLADDDLRGTKGGTSLYCSYSLRIKCCADPNAA